MKLKNETKINMKNNLLLYYIHFKVQIQVQAIADAVRDQRQLTKSD